MARSDPSPVSAAPAVVAAAPLRVLLIDDGAHRVSLIHDALARQEHLVVGVLDSALLTDCAPLVVAYEKHFFEDEDLNVTLEAQANWKVLLDRVIDGQLDGAHMLAGQPLGATIGFGTKAEVVTALSMDLNGNAISVSNAVWA